MLKSLLQLALLALALLMLQACGSSHSPATFATFPSELAPVAQLSLDGVLSELAATPAPAGVDAAVFDQLKAELARQLSNRAVNKLVSTAPPGDAGRVDDLESVPHGHGAVLSWHYCNVGDYDQNGTVGISDITPIAMLYNSEVQGGDDNSLTAVVDGSGNGKVGIEDVTPIAMNFSATVAGYRIESCDTQNGSYEPVQLVSFSQASGEGRLQFSVELGAVPPSFFRVVAHDSSGAVGDGSNLAACGYDPPVIYSVSPTRVHEGDGVRFFASAASSLPAQYSWSFGGGATPDTSNEESPTVTIGATGEYQATLTVTSLAGTAHKEFTLDARAPAERMWNFAVYMGADNNLSENAFVDIQEMEQVGSTDDVAINVQAEMYGYPFYHNWVERLLVVHDENNSVIRIDGDPANESIDRYEFDSASPQALADYLQWSQDNFDASRIALTLWNHGAGWDNGKAVSGIICDDTAGTLLADYEIASVMADTGVYWDVLNMDACIMGSLEVAYEYRNVARYLVFSQLGIPLQGQPYMPIAQALVDHPEQDGASLAQVIADEFIAYYNENPTIADPGVAISVVDLAKMNEVIAGLDELAQLVIDHVDAERTPFTAAAESADSTTYWGDVDAMDFLQKYRAETSNSEVRDCIDSLLASLAGLVVSEDAVSVSHDYSGLCGVSLWVPQSLYFTYYEAEYRTTSFARDTKWRQMLADVTQSEATMVEADLRAELTWDTNVDVDLYVLEPDQWEPSGQGLHSPWYGYSGNGVFSQDSAVSGVSEETWTSKSEVMAGKYTFLAHYYGDSYYFDHATVTIRVYDGDDLIIEDTIDMDRMTPVDLTYGMGWHLFGSVALMAEEP